jgi:catalase-peroxidase
VPAREHPLIDEASIAQLKTALLASGLSVTQLVWAAWASASTYRNSDKRGGANGARVRLAPQRDWAANEPAALAKVLAALEAVQQSFNAAQSAAGKSARVSLADVIVLGGCAAVEHAAKQAGFAVRIPFTLGRTDASQTQTDVESFAALEPKADGFRNFVKAGLEEAACEMLVDRAGLLGLTAPQMTVLLGGLRSLGITRPGTQLGVLTQRPGTLSNDFFVHLLDMNTQWQRSASDRHVLEGRDRTSGTVKWKATTVDLVFGSNSQLRALSEVYASADAGQQFVDEFTCVWTKLMDADRFDIAR